MRCAAGGSLVCDELFQAFDPVISENGYRIILIILAAVDIQATVLCEHVDR